MVAPRGDMPKYGELLAEMGRQIGARKWLFMRRTFLLAWPGLIAVAAWFILQSLVEGGKGEITPAIDAWGSLLLWIFLIAGIFLGAPYYVILSAIFSIEKTIWVDSFFDGRNLDPKASWRIARRLFFPRVFLSLQLFLRFYALTIAGAALILSEAQSLPSGTTRRLARYS